MEPNQAQYDAILIRLGNLEKQNRKLKVVGLVAFLMTLVLGVTAWTGSKHMVYEGEFVLTDKNGKKRGHLFVDEIGCPNLDLIAENGSIAASFGLFSAYGAPFLSLSDENHQTRVNIGLIPSGVPFITLYDKHGNTAWQVSDE
jgi:hypothetical protein